MAEQNETINLLTVRQRRAIAALLVEATLERAAAASGISRTTLWRWLADPTFRRALEVERHRQTGEALAYLSGSLLRAVQRLHELLNSENEATSFKAAHSLLQFGLQTTEQRDLEQRIGELEARLRDNGLGRI